jgi:hypothetical protein
MKTRIFASILLLLIFTACISLTGTAIIFRLYDGSKFTGESIAVIAGIRDSNSLRLTEEVTNKLLERANFEVLSLEDIKAAIPAYPATILDSKDGISDADRAKFIKIQEKLGTDYIFVLWGNYFNERVSNGIVSNYFGIKGSLLEFPGAASIGESDFQWSMSKKLFESRETYMERFFNNAASTIVDDFMERIGK